jgi:cytochrome c oxidase subunit 2
MTLSGAKALVTLALLATLTITLSAQQPAREIDVHAKRFAFSPAEITVQKGETIKIVLTSEDVTHSLVIPDLHVDVEVSKGHPGEATFTATTAGDFQGRCGHFCGPGHGSMVFTVHVKDN